MGVGDGASIDATGGGTGDGGQGDVGNLRVLRTRLGGKETKHQTGSERSDCQRQRHSRQQRPTTFHPAGYSGSGGTGKCELHRALSCIPP